MYLVKVTYIAKENNPNFKGESHVYYFGKDGHSTKNLNDYFANKYGYSREGDAKRNYHFNYPSDEIYWNKNIEIVEV